MWIHLKPIRHSSNEVQLITYTFVRANEMCLTVFQVVYLLEIDERVQLVNRAR